MALLEYQAIQNTNRMHSKVNHVTFEKLCSSVLFNCAWTPENETRAAVSIYNFFHDNGAGHYIKEIVLRQFYNVDRKTKKETFMYSKLFNSKEQRYLTHDDMARLWFVMPC